MKKISGLVAAPFTPFNEDGSAAFHKIPKLAKLYQSNGVAGVFICGTTGEGPSLTMDEKIEFMRIWGLEKGPLKTVFMLGGNCLRDQQMLAELSVQQNMDAVAVLPPFFFRPGSAEELVKHCQLIARSAGDLPFYFYHIPGMTGVHLSIRRFLEVADGQIPNLAGVKFSAPDMPDFHSAFKYKQGKFNLLWGTDEALLSALAVGLNGAVGSTYNYATPLYHKIISAFNSGDMMEAQIFQLKAVQMVELLIKYGGIAAGKAFMKIIGMDCGPCRSPLSTVTDQACLSLEKELREIGFFDFCSKIPA